MKSLVQNVVKNDTMNKIRKFGLCFSLISAGMYLFISQMVWFLCHTVAWVAYCVFTIVQDEEDVVFSV